MIERLGGITAIQVHVASLTEYLYERLTALRHSNGRPMVQIFGKHHYANHREVRGQRVAAARRRAAPAGRVACIGQATP
jgi:hypothetical protein